MPLPVFADTVSSGTSLDLREAFGQRRLDPVEQRRRILGDVPLVERDDQRAAFLDDLVGDPEVLRFEAPGRVEQQNDDLGIIDRALGIGGGQPLELVLDLRALPQARGIDQLDLPALPFPVEADRIARDPGLGPGDHPLLAEHPVDQGRLAGVGPPDDRQLERTARARLPRPPSSSLDFDMRPERIEQIDDAFTMLRAERDRVAEAEPEGLEDAATRRRGPRPCWRRRSPASPRPGASGRFPRRAASGPRARRPGTMPRPPRAPPPRSAARIRPGSVCGSSSSKPAVSITRNSSPSSFASPSRRSRVTPGRSSTSARRLPTSRLNSVDLPTLGRPTMATVGKRHGGAAIAAPSSGAAESLSGTRAAGAVVVDVERRIGDHRRQADARADAGLALVIAGRRVDVDDYPFDPTTISRPPARIGPV